MHANSAHMMTMANSFWPFAYSLKSYDLSVHPAFISSAYRKLPTLPSTYNVTPRHVQSSPPPSNKVDKFSIDAILSKDNNRAESTSSSPVQDLKKYSQNFTDNDKIHDSSISRRHQRLFETSHPYLGHTNVLPELHHQQQQCPMSSAYRQLTESPRITVSDKIEKKCNIGNQSWSKNSKGKRVRTIFTPEQLERMEAEFERQQYMVGTERYYLASSLNLTEAQVKVWFQNRRIKWRKQHLEQQKAKLSSIDIYNQDVSDSESDSDDDNRTHGDVMSGHMVSLADPFQSPREIRSTQ